MALHCSICDAQVLRTECHRNRYDEYICHGCQAAGVRFSWRNRLRYQIGKARLPIGLVLAATALVVLTILFFELMSLLQPAKVLTG